MELKISVITDEFGTRDLEQVADYLAAEGCRYVELRGAWIKNVITTSDDNIGAVKGELRLENLNAGKMIEDRNLSSWIKIFG
jgi:sugar phosphate isomerase/epimerase